HASGRPYIEMSCLAHLSIPLMFRSFTRARRSCAKAITLAQENGWAEDPMATVAYAVLGSMLVWQMRLEEAQRQLDLAPRAVRPELEPSTGIALLFTRGRLELAHGHDDHALELFKTAVRLNDLLAGPHALA